MKILFLGRYNGSSILTGPEKVAERIFSKCSDDFETLFITYFFDGGKYNLFTKLFGSEEITGTGKGRIYRLGIFRILGYMFSFRPDIIHIINFERFAKVAYLYKRFKDVKVYYTVHGIAKFENDNNPNATEKLKKKDLISEVKYFRDSDRLIFLSERSVNTAEKYFEFDRSKTVIIPNGIDEVFHQTGEEKVKGFNEVLKLVFAGDAGKIEKGLKFLESSLMESDFPLEVFIVGNNYNEKEEKRKNITFKFKVKMGTDSFAKFLSDKDLFVSASTYEQFSITSVEAMAAGLVTVVTAETGMASYIHNGINGFVINYGDKKALINTLSIINSDRKLSERIQEEGKKIYLLLSWEMVYRKYKKLYD